MPSRLGSRPLPPPTANKYNDSYRGWPVGPTKATHVARGTFNDPRPTKDPSFHFGVDISVDDDHPEPGAPAGHSHRIYAVESGVVSVPPGNERAGLDGRKMQIGHFSYWHADWVGTVKPGEHVRAGQMIGWTATNEWHVHLSEWKMIDGKRVWVNPLRPGGKLGPTGDTTKPVIHQIEFYGPAKPKWEFYKGTKRVFSADAGARLNPNKLQGLVDMRVWTGDPMPKQGFIKSRPDLQAEQHPYELKIAIRSSATGKVVFTRKFVNDVLASEKTTFDNHYAPGTIQNLPGKLAVDEFATTPGGNKYWLRAFDNGKSPYWDTRRMREGGYVVDVTVSDASGNRTSAHRLVQVKNR